MRRFGLYSALAVGVTALCVSCSGTSARFVVDVGDSDPVNATIELYGEAEQMTRSENEFAATRTIDRDGSGTIRIFYDYSDTIECDIGYVTSGMSENWEFAIEDGECRQVSGPGID